MACIDGGVRWHWDICMCWNEIGRMRWQQRMFTAASFIWCEEYCFVGLAASDCTSL